MTFLHECPTFRKKIARNEPWSSQICTIIFVHQYSTEEREPIQAACNEEMWYRLVLLVWTGYNVRELGRIRYIHETTNFSWPTDASVQYISRLAHPWTPQQLGNSPMYGPFFPQFLKIRFYEDRRQDLNDPDRAIARSNLTSWLLTRNSISTRATSMFHTVTSSTAPFTLGRIP